ncbi:cation:proton antiporter [Kitasatospora sp. NBC_01287]|uniref:cation:proton antiporter n=1 Tax=Kitasatospora sp. NBC_01287 TaxID=2903573 RepID=UPI00224D67B8|nr:cation:proton antiporter [Kitasatospora sp. NBC_01287]MCX4744749.1 cation:proton antiporter [Kitasatospora sp. NBC_01287]
MSQWAVVVAGVVVVGYGTLSRRLARTAVSGPLVFTLCGLAIGPLGLGLMDQARDPEVTRTLLEGALVLLLFADAAAIRGRDLRREEFLPLRLLALGLPATMALGWLAAWPLLPGLSWGELALVGVILAPTDAALGQQAVANERVPALVRGGLAVESGVNDGLALPFFVLALAAAGEGHGYPGVVPTFARALLLSGVIGLAAGWAGASLLHWSAVRRWSGSDWAQFLVLGVPVIAYGTCAAAEGSGFIGAWVSGFAFGVRLRRVSAGGGGVRAPAPDPVRSTAFTERLGLLLASLSFLVFGAVILGPALQHVTWRIVVYAVLSLTVVRMLPVALALLGTGLRPASVAYVGWFGPRGLASLVFGLIAIEEHLPGITLLGDVIAVSVGLSVLLHGATAPFLGDRYADWFTRALRAEPGLRENALAADGRSGAPSAR